MGFFSDLKDDLSQAVNEMIPEEEGMAAGEGESLPDVDLSAMLDRMEAGEADAEASMEQEAEAVSLPFSGSFAVSSALPIAFNTLFKGRLEPSAVILCRVNLLMSVSRIRLSPYFTVSQKESCVKTSEINGF